MHVRRLYRGLAVTQFSRAALRSGGNGKVGLVFEALVEALTAPLRSLAVVTCKAITATAAEPALQMPTCRDQLLDTIRAAEHAGLFGEGIGRRVVSMGWLAPLPSFVLNNTPKGHLEAPLPAQCASPCGLPPCLPTYLPACWT